MPRCCATKEGKPRMRRLSLFRTLTGQLPADTPLLTPPRTPLWEASLLPNPRAEPDAPSSGQPGFPRPSSPAGAESAGVRPHPAETSAGPSKRPSPGLERKESAGQDALRILEVSAAKFKTQMAKRVASPRPIDPAAGPPGLSAGALPAQALRPSSGLEERVTATAPPDPVPVPHGDPAAKGPRPLTLSEDAPAGEPPFVEARSRPAGPRRGADVESRTREERPEAGGRIAVPQPPPIKPSASHPPSDRVPSLAPRVESRPAVAPRGREAPQRASIHIGSLTVRVVPPSPQPRPQARIVPPAPRVPLSRAMTSSFGLVQG